MFMRHLRDNMKTILIITVIVFGGSVFYGFGTYMTGRGGTSGQVVANVASVNGVSISREEFNQALRNEMQMHRNITARMSGMVKSQLLDRMIERHLVLEEARGRVEVGSDEVEEEMQELKENFESEEQFAQQLEMLDITEAMVRDSIRESLLIERMQQEIMDSAEVTEEEIAEAYEEVEARHILITFEEEKDRDEARDKIEELRSRLEDGEDFSELAREYSEDGSAEDGGQLGSFGRGEMVAEFEEAAFALESGQISDIVETQYGFHIIKVEDRQLAEGEDFEAAREEIVQSLREEKREETYQDWYRELRADADVTIHDPEIRGYSLAREGEYEKSLASFQEALEMEYQNPYLYGSMAELHEELGDREQAMEKYAKAAELTEEPDYYYQVGEFYHEQGKEEEALENFELAFENAGDNHYLYYLLENKFAELEEQELLSKVQQRQQELQQQLMEQEDMGVPSEQMTVDEFEEEMIEEEGLEEEPVVEDEPDFELEE